MQNTNVITIALRPFHAADAAPTAGSPAASNAAPAFNPPAFVNARAEEIARSSGKWGADESAKLLADVAEEMTQLECWDADTFRVIAQRYCNTNAVANRFAEKGWITRRERGAAKVSDLV